MWTRMDREHFAVAAQLHFPDLAEAFLEGDEFFSRGRDEYISLKCFNADRLLWITGVWTRDGRVLTSIRQISAWARRSGNFDHIGFTMNRSHPMRPAFVRYTRAEKARENERTISYTFGLDSARFKEA